MPLQGALDLYRVLALPGAFDSSLGVGSINAHCRSLQESRLLPDLNRESAEKILAELEECKLI